MSDFLNKRLNFPPYVPGEQPRVKNLIKLNTNENPYFPSRFCLRKSGKKAVENLRLYSDPESLNLRRAIAKYYGLEEGCVLPANGSDEALAFIFAAFCDGGAIFPDVTYGFYKVLAKLFGVDFEEVALRPDFTVNINAYLGCKRTVFLANPNAQTGIYLAASEIEKIVKSNPENVVVVDEAYIDFGGESVVPLTRKYNNLIVVQTFSKSRSLAGARVGFAVADKSLIEDLERVKDSFNPYNVNSLSSALAAAAIEDKSYFKECVEKVISTRTRLIKKLKDAGFEVLPSKANFVLAKCRIQGGILYEKLRDRGILVRHFDDERIRDFIRITIGTDAQIDALVTALKEILYEECRGSL